MMCATEKIQNSHQANGLGPDVAGSIISPRSRALWIAMVVCTPSRATFWRNLFRPEFSDSN